MEPDIWSELEACRDCPGLPQHGQFGRGQRPEFGHAAAGRRAACLREQLEMDISLPYAPSPWRLLPRGVGSALRPVNQTREPPLWQVSAF